MFLNLTRIYIVKLTYLVPLSLANGDAVLQKQQVYEHINFTTSDYVAWEKVSKYLFILFSYSLIERYQQHSLQYKVEYFSA